MTIKMGLVSVIKNEERDIAEWLAYHLALGFDRILLYDHRSTDRTASIVRRFAARFPVEMIGYVYVERWRPFQARPFMEAAKSLAQSCDWILACDADEFLMGEAPETFREFLAAQPPEVAQICLNWRIFGSGGHERRPEGSLLIETFTKCAPPNFWSNHHVKSVARPQKILDCFNAHFFVVNGKTVDVDGNPIKWKDPAKWSLEGMVESKPKNEKFWINHYFTKSREEWERKIARGYPDMLRPADEFHIYDVACVVEDERAAALAPRVRHVLAGLPQRAQARRLSQPGRIWHRLRSGLLFIWWFWRAFGEKATYRRLAGRVGHKAKVSLRNLGLRARSALRTQAMGQDAQG
jgi:glycosyltransferase involved in cell wall biosynthesis